jgi:acetyl-CoA carboxylase carboxyl transferase subunit alpha
VSIFANLTPWQITQLARHPHRPYTLDYVNAICAEFNELHGDRMYADDGAIVGGLARIDQRAVMIIGHQKGRDTKERVRRNYGMPKPEGYRKALRLMRLAERFSLPLVTLIDTQGAYPGVGAEERGQSEAIARNLFEMSVLRIPIVTVVTGEGGSGGALGIGVCDRLIMLQFSTYSVISPEGCAGILWNDGARAADAVERTQLEVFGQHAQRHTEPVERGAAAGTGVATAVTIRPILDEVAVVQLEIGGIRGAVAEFPQEAAELHGRLNEEQIVQLVEIESVEHVLEAICDGDPLRV